MSETLITPSGTLCWSTMYTWCMRVLASLRMWVVSLPPLTGPARLTHATTMPCPAPSRGSTGLVGVATRPAKMPLPWGATSCRKAHCTYLHDHGR